MDDRRRTDRLLGFGYIGVALSQLPMAWRIANDPQESDWERGFWGLLVAAVVVLCEFRFVRAVLRLRDIGQCARPGIEEGYITALVAFCGVHLLGLLNHWVAILGHSAFALTAVSTSLYYFAWPPETQ